MPSRRLKGSRPPLPRCVTCGKSVRKSMVRQPLPDGGCVCARCIAAGVTFRRLSCGHMAVVGSKVTEAARASDSRCAACDGNVLDTEHILGSGGIRWR